MINKKISDLKKELKDLSDPKQAKILKWFFRAEKGGYGEGDRFIGLKVPAQRKIAKKYTLLSLTGVEKLLKNEIHEYRFTALVILDMKFEKADKKERKEIYDIVLRNLKYINNWDLIDIPTRHIVGGYLLDKPKDILYRLARSKDLWQKRIAIMATFPFIMYNKFEDTLRIAEILVNDSHDLIHKAVGWMLREVGNRNQKLEEKFLKKYYKRMPRTMLRYAIEKFNDKKRKFYLKK